MPSSLIALWRGDFPLGQAFWHYAIAYGTIANILATAAAIAAVLAGLPDAVAIGLHFLPLPYVVTAVVGVWRSANKYRGDPTWAGIAKAAVILWAALMFSFERGAGRGAVTGGAFVNSSEALFQAGLKVDGGERLLLMDAVLRPHWREASDFIQHPSLEIDVIEQRPRGT